MRVAAPAANMSRMGAGTTGECTHLLFGILEAFVSYDSRSMLQWIRSWCSGEWSVRSIPVSRPYMSTLCQRST